ncbi:hypothetical protein BDP27DRAFT_1433914 [Rhodocollybia butyracea]|uniref:DEAD/DEAH-box helicase domain-containing protein n=1 Tax=Rhodocollybia butyracea TaxID=206335 RepID=A0A9P5P7A3_9AGAR|nr:hypothetical protein BDP27DRAFT_1433914 [Rhodocollybia butyracea]
MALVYPQTLLQFLDIIRDENFEELLVRLKVIKNGNRGRIPFMFIISLPNMDRQITALRMCLLVYYTTKGAEVPKILQLHAALESISRNTLVTASTGFGKTHIMALLMLLEKSTSTRIFITLSPLKRLQITQVVTFLEKYGISTISINQDTPRDIQYWRKYVHDTRKNATQLSTSRHLIVTAEQLFKSPEGHWTCFFTYSSRASVPQTDSSHQR